MALLKSGWLWRQSSILRRWKRSWFVLYLDGALVYYHDESQREEEGSISLRPGCRDVRVGRECRAVQPPEGKSRDCLLALALRDGSATTLCAESEDDASARQTARCGTKIRLCCSCAHSFLWRPGKVLGEDRILEPRYISTARSPSEEVPGCPEQTSGPSWGINAKLTTRPGSCNHGLRLC
uniref:Pleckstrin homology domain containing B1 n=1 Tax=Apteryx owenii TaxID=8824 RepID=A0A8B9PNT0_APTOW